jgi:ssDNA-binding Zn-finger/Zn-ribbon topoisomerase 1
MPFFRILRADLGLEITRLVRDRVLIGRALANDLVINGDFVAVSHCGVAWHDDAYWLTNFAAAGTRLNGAEVNNEIKHAALLPGDVIECGAYRLHVKTFSEGLQLEVRTDLNQPAPSHEPRAEVTPEHQAWLEQYWQAQRSAAGMDNLIEVDAASGQWRPTLPHELNEAPSAKFSRWPKRGWLALRIALVLLALAAITALVFPRAFAPGGVSKTHQRGTSKAAAHARQPVTSQCLSCHGVTGSVQNRCVTCHTTERFQPVLSAQHTKLNLQCATCHAEHRGAQASLTQAAQAACTNCHQSTMAAKDKLHGAAVAYPINRFGVWSWDGVSVESWQQRQLPGVPSDYTAREQFHMLHGEGRAGVGRTRCTDCHLAGAAAEQLKQNVRESCAQCHALKPALAAELARTSGLKQGTTQCFACHSQHGAARDAKASNRQPTTGN